MGSSAYVIILFLILFFQLLFIYFLFLLLVYIFYCHCNGSDDSTVSVTICCLSMKHDNSWTAALDEIFARTRADCAVFRDTLSLHVTPPRWPHTDWRVVNSVDFSTWRDRWLLPVAFWSANWYAGYSCPGERLNANYGFKAFRSGVRNPFGTDRQTDGRIGHVMSQTHVANMKRPHNNLLSFLSLYLTIFVGMHKPD